MKTIMIVEDEEYIREELNQMLMQEGYATYLVTDFISTVEQAQDRNPDLLLLDMNLPGISGFQICQEVKQRTTIPVLVLTSRDQMKDELLALSIGADEYLTKPFRKERLLARVANVLKRYEGRKKLLEGRGYLLDCQTYTLYREDVSVILPKNQGILLSVFLKNANRIIAKEELSFALWQTAEYIDENALQVNLTRLRKTMQKLSIEQKIVTVPGRGYQIVSEVSE